MNPFTTDPYRILGIPGDADSETITRAYRHWSRLAAQLAAPEQEVGRIHLQHRLDTACALLSDPAARQAHDAARERPAPTGDDAYAPKLLALRPPKEKTSKTGQIRKIEETLMFIFIAIVIALLVLIVGIELFGHLNCPVQG